MALTNSQVQQVYLAITGRPAEGNAVTWASNANSVVELANLVIDTRKNSDFTSNDQFVNHLYQYLLNDTAPDAEGFAYWTGLLKGSTAEDGTVIPAISKAELIEQFINAVLAQNQTDHKYTLLNKTQIAEDFGNDVASFTGGKQAENYLKDVIFSHVDKNTSYADIEEYATNFKGQYVNVASVTVQQGAEEATLGSETNATNYNATLDLAGDGDIQIIGSTDYDDTLNLKVTGDADNQEVTGSNFSNIQGVSNVNIDMNHDKAAAVTLATSDIQGVKNLVIKGSSVDDITVDTPLTSVDTGAGKDTINIQAKVDTVQAGAGNDDIIVSVTDKTMSIDGGAGSDTLTFSGAAGTTADDFTKLSIKGVEKLAGAGLLASSQVDGENFTLATGSNFAVKATNGVDLSKLKLDEGAANVTLAANEVKSGKVTLIKSDDPANANPTVDTVALHGSASKVNIENIASGDMLDVRAITVISALTGAATELIAATTTAAVTMAANTFYFVNDQGTVNTTAKAEAALKGLGVKDLAAGSGAAVAFNDGKGKAYIYSVEGVGTAGAGTKFNDTLKLVAIVDNNIYTNDTATTAGVITFA